MGFFKDLFSGKKKEVVTTSITDPMKVSVANPLSKYLISGIGKGIPRYSGDMGASISPFMSKTVDDLYGDIEKSAVDTFKNNYSDILENNAGALTSSRRAYGDKMAVTELSLGLAEKRAGLELALPQAQEALKQADFQRWLTSLPEYNPILDKAMIFLNDQTSSGTTWMSWLDPGRKAGMYEIINASAQAAAAAAAAGGA